MLLEKVFAIYNCKPRKSTDLSFVFFKKKKEKNSEEEPNGAKFAIVVSPSNLLIAVHLALTDMKLSFIHVQHISVQLPTHRTRTDDR